MKQSHSDDQELFDIVMSFITSDEVKSEKKDYDPNAIINFEKLNILIEAF